MLPYTRIPALALAAFAAAALQVGLDATPVHAESGPPPGTSVHKGLAPLNQAAHTRSDVNTSTDYAGPAAAAAGGPLVANGGAVLTTPRVFISYWGPEWSAGFSTGGYSSAQARQYVESFFSGVGGSGWAASNQQYCSNAPVGSSTCAGLPTVGNPAGQLAGAWIDNTAVPASPNSGDIAWAAVRAAQHFGQIPGAIYMVLTPSGKSEVGFGTQWCAWHGATYISTSGPALAYGYIPYMPDAGSKCGVNYINPSDGFGHGWFDGYSIVGGHEYAEALTDPFPSSGWVDSAGNENGDKCAWSRGQAGNTILASGVFAVQPIWSNQAGGCVLATTAPPPPPPAPTVYTGGSFNAIPPTRVMDTRSGIGGGAGSLGPGQTRTLQVAGAAGVPSGATAVTVNLTVTNPSAAGYLSVWPAGAPQPTASNLNFQAGQTVANLVQVPLGSGGALNFYNSFGSTDVIADVNGYTAPTGAAYTALSPQRLLDTRSSAGPLGAGASVSVPGIPAGATAVVLNVTAVNPSSPGYLTAYPGGAAVPTASNVNFQAGQTVPNRVIVQVGSGVSIYNFTGSTDVVVDLDGYYGGGASSFTGLSPTRILDTRSSGAHLGQGGVLTLQGTGGAAQVPAGAKAVVLNVTAANTFGSSFLTLYPNGTGRPIASDLNWTSGQVVPNLVIASVGAGGSIEVFNFQGSTDVIVDVLGYYS